MRYAILMRCAQLLTSFARTHKARPFSGAKRADKPETLP
jgi:hypothetical protein